MQLINQTFADRLIEWKKHPCQTFFGTDALKKLDHMIHVQTVVKF